MFSAAKDKTNLSIIKQKHNHLCKEKNILEKMHYLNKLASNMGPFVTIRHASVPWNEQKDTLIIFVLDFSYHMSIITKKWSSTERELKGNWKLQLSELFLLLAYWTDIRHMYITPFCLDYVSAKNQGLSLFILTTHMPCA